MIYKVTKTSIWEDHIKPCEEAFKKEIIDKSYWVVELKTEKELFDFIFNYSPVVIFGSNKDDLTIEIYDDYRE